MRAPEIRKTSPRDDSHSSLWTRLGDYLAIPMRLALAPIVGLLFGWLLDRWLGTFPWLTILVLILGFVEAARELWVMAKETERNERR
ncbi:MAG: AtpZ/AtpI family protein [Candidatus Omnitrophica bacterium]|nr:AtpZ/AtpI family protein [Candidatus Omnitrophota bacterium]